MRRFLLAAAMCVVIGGLGALLVAATGPEDAPARDRFLPPPVQAADFELADQDGRTRSIASARGNVLVVSFLFTHCHDLCPAEAVEIGEAMERVGSGVLAYAVSVDPVADTPTRAKDFIRLRDLDPRTFKFLLGTRAQLAPVWAAYGIAPINATPEEAIAAAKATDAYRRSAEYGPPGRRRPYEPPVRDAPEAASDDYPDPADFSYRGRARHEAGLDFEHSAYAMVIDKHGRQRVGIPFEQLDPAGLAADIEALRREP
jgi:protein SCO1/2